MSIVQLNLAYQPNANTSLIFMVGHAEDDFAFSDASGNIQAGNVFLDAAGDRQEGANVVKANSGIDYFVLEAKQYLVPNKFYLAARYANSTNDTDGINSDDTLERIQVAAGYWFNEKTLWKFEFVDQDEEENSGGQIGGGFDGFVTELSVKL